MVEPSRSAAKKLDRLRQQVVSAGGAPELLDAWQCFEVTRTSGTSAGARDFYFGLAQQGSGRFRSIAEVLRHLGLARSPSSRKRPCSNLESSLDRAGATGDVPPSTAPPQVPQFVRTTKEPTRARGVVIGQAPPIAAGPDFVPLSGSAEQRLARLAGLDLCELWQRFDRRNLLDEYPGRKAKAARHQRENGYRLHQSTGDEFPMERARSAAATIDLSGYSLAVLLGLQVARSGIGLG